MTGTHFCCPLCGGALTVCGNALRCAQGHSFDIASQGYVHLLPVQKMRTKIPGDSREMIAARQRFLNAGFYAPFREGIASLVCRALRGIPSPVVVDAGCGEGYYTAGILSALISRGHTPAVCGFDISKWAVIAAAKRHCGAEFAVAGSFAIPLPDASADVLTAVFSPIAEAEFARVVRPGGMLLLAVAGQRHLYGLKQVLYEHPYENEHKKTDYPGFAFLSRTPIRGEITLTDKQQISDLFSMTPYYWKTPAEGAKRLAQLTELTTEIGFDLVCYKRV